MWHRIENNLVVESTDIDPAGRFHHSLVWVADAGAGAQVGWSYDADTSTFTRAQEIPPLSVAQVLESVKAQMRITRMPKLDALTGIAGRAHRAGNMTLAAEADALAEALLDITDDPALNAATTLQDMQAAGLAAYRAIAATASAELASVFKEITGV